MTIKPQKGKQESFLSSPADIVFYGGQAGGGKTWALLSYPLYSSHVKGFNGTIFRRTKEQIRDTGGLWDSAVEIYKPLGAYTREQPLDIRYENMKLKFAHLEHEKDKYNWDGAQICYLGFDELQSFTETMFWYLIGRNRSTCGINPFVRATCMADADSWIKQFIIWWLDAEGKYADESKAGVIRWFIRLRDSDRIVWFESEEKANLYIMENALYDIVKVDGVEEKRPLIPMSFTFIPASLEDNKILMEKDPKYAANLNALQKIDRERKKYGNWAIKPQAGLYFRREYFKMIQRGQLPAERSIVRFWDRAATEKTVKNDPAWTCGVKMSKDNNGIFYIEHVSRFRATTGKRDEQIKNITKADGNKVTVGLEQEPGASGKSEIHYLAQKLLGYPVKPVPARENKITRALPMSSQAEIGNIKVVEAPWNDAYFAEMENFDADPKKKKDQVDASSGAFNLLSGGSIVSSTFAVDNPEIKENREIDIDKRDDMRGEYGNNTERPRLI
jgi:predicted phage terminase large subunit-like protein